VRKTKPKWTKKTEEKIKVCGYAAVGKIEYGLFVTFILLGLLEASPPAQ
jgi:hypothetical protein